MADISSALIKKLREKTGAGIMDCKRALIATSGNIEDAIDWLRKSGVFFISSKAARIATNGLVGVASSKTHAVIIEVNSETDFVARNALFQNFVHTVINLSLKVPGDLERLKQLIYPGCNRTVEEEVSRLITIIGENIKIRRTNFLEVRDSIIASYVHGQITTGLGKIAVLVSLECSVERDKVFELGHQIAMHIAAAAPQFVDIPSVQKAALDRERSILQEQAHILGKPEAVTSRIVDGKLQKYYEEVVLLEQIYAIDSKSRIKDILQAVSQEINSPLKVRDFIRFSLGETISCE